MTQPMFRTADEIFGKSIDLDLREPWTELRERAKQSRMNASRPTKKSRRLSLRETAVLRRVWAKLQGKFR